MIITLCIPRETFEESDLSLTPNETKRFSFPLHLLKIVKLKLKLKYPTQEKIFKAIISNQRNEMILFA